MGESKALEIIEEAKLLKFKLENIYRLMLSNAKNRRPVHPLAYIKYIQDTIDMFNIIELSVIINQLKELIKRLRSHIEYNAHSMESMYCIELSQIINQIDQVIKLLEQDSKK